MTDRLSIAVAGAAGRMGRQLVAAALDRGLGLAGGTEAPASELIGADLGRLAGREDISVAAVADVAEAAQGAHVWIDFTTPAATLSALAHLPKSGVRAAIIGTTGFSDLDEARIRDAAGALAIVKAGNFSLGVALLSELVRLAAGKLGADWDIEILETHHRDKVDAPSGTALALGEAAAVGRGASLPELRAAPYDGPAAKREPGTIGFAVRRAGGVVGEHEVAIASRKEVLSLSHAALDRSVFAEGAVEAAIWAARQPPGLYDMTDVLGL